MSKIDFLKEQIIEARTVVNRLMLYSVSFNETDLISW